MTFMQQHLLYSPMAVMSVAVMRTCASFLRVPRNFAQTATCPWLSVTVYCSLSQNTFGADQWRWSGRKQSNGDN